MSDSAGGFNLRISLHEDDAMEYHEEQQQQHQAGESGYRSPSCTVVPVLKPMFPSPAMKSRMLLEPFALPPSALPSTPETKSEVKCAKISPYAREDDPEDQLYFNFR
jgi:hypothetical protein